MTRRVPTVAPDVEEWLVGVLTPAVAPALVRTTRPAGPHGPLLVVRADMQQHITPITRYARVGMSAWVLRADGTGDVHTARALAAAAAAAVEDLPRVGLLIDAETETGPYRVVDSITGTEYVHVGMLLQVLVA